MYFLCYAWGFTGTIIGMSQALGESAPLLMIGMVAFIVDTPGSISDSQSYQYKFICGKAQQPGAL